MLYFVCLLVNKRLQRDQVESQPFLFFNYMCMQTLQIPLWTLSPLPIIIHRTNRFDRECAHRGAAQCWRREGTMCLERIKHRFQ